MIRLMVLYGPPNDPATFERYYQQTHIPLVQKIPGLKGFVTSKPAVLNPQERSPYYLIAELYFENMAALQAALQSPERQATVNDLQNFATGGVTVLTGELQVYHPVSLS